MSKPLLIFIYSFIHLFSTNQILQAASDLVKTSAFVFWSGECARCVCRKKTSIGVKEIFCINMKITQNKNILMGSNSYSFVSTECSSKLM